MDMEKGIKEPYQNKTMVGTLCCARLQEAELFIYWLEFLCQLCNDGKYQELNLAFAT